MLPGDALVYFLLALYAYGMFMERLVARLEGLAQKSLARLQSGPWS